MIRVVQIVRVQDKAYTQHFELTIDIRSVDGRACIQNTYTDRMVSD